MRDSLRTISETAFWVMYCDECGLHFCIERARNREALIHCSYCGKKYLLEKAYVEVK